MDHPLQPLRRSQLDLEEMAQEPEAEPEVQHLAESLLLLAVVTLH